MNGRQQCFVCQPLQPRYIDRHELQKMWPGEGEAESVPFCHEYKRSRRDEYIRECPENYQACMTKIQGEQLRSWESLGLLQHLKMIILYKTILELKA